MPDDLYQRAKTLSARKEISLAELTRRGLEYMLSVYTEAPVEQQSWVPPVPQDMGWKGLDEEQLKDASRPDAGM